MSYEINLSYLTVFFIYFGASFTHNYYDKHACQGTD